MNKVISKDGTSIAYTRTGKGPAVVFVDGATNYMDFGWSGPLASLLKMKFTVFTYDRRGRGASSDIQPYAIEREIEDIDALIKEAGGSVYIYGKSSGAILSLDAAADLKGIKKLALYEPPFIVDDSRPPLPDNFIQRLNGLLASEQKDEAVELFLKLMGTPEISIGKIRLTPAWSKLKAIAHTIPYDMIIVKDYEKGKPLSNKLWSEVKIPIIVISGEKSPVWMQNSRHALLDIFPEARNQTLKEQTHDVNPEILAPVIIKFFEGY